MWIPSALGGKYPSRPGQPGWLGPRQPGLGCSLGRGSARCLAPTRLWYGESDTPCPPAHGRWYADRIPGAELVILPGAGHVDVIDGHWPDVLAGLLAIWGNRT